MGIQVDKNDDLTDKIRALIPDQDFVLVMQPKADRNSADTQSAVMMKSDCDGRVFAKLIALGVVGGINMNPIIGDIIKHYVENIEVG